MLTSRLRRFLTTPVSKSSNSQVIFWFSLSLTFAAIYALLGLGEAFSGEYVIQDDARQHVFWMRRFLDPELFPNDLIADYFQSVAPLGYTTFYQLFAALGIDPVLASKLLPLVLSLVTTSYCFGISLQILPVPATGFMASLLLNQNLWYKDDLVSATPRAFIYPLLLAFLYYLLQRSLILCLGAIALQGLFYPQCLFISAGVIVLQMLRWEKGRVRLSPRRSDYWFCAAGLGVVLSLLLPYALTTSQFGPIISVAEAKTLPEFLPGGRAEFFYDTPWVFWLKGRAGMVSPTLFRPITLSAGLLLPILLRYSSRLPLVRKLKSETIILAQLTLVSFSLFFAAHALLFKLHLPSRYTKHSLRIVLALAAAIVLTIILDAVFHWAQKQTQLGLQGQKGWAIGTTALIGIALVMNPSCFPGKFPLTGYIVGQEPALYEFFSQTPKDSLIASLTDEASNLPTFSQRSVLVSSEYAIPYHTGYYRLFRQRVIDLIEAQYSPNLAEVKNFIQKDSIDFWLLERKAFTSEYLVNSWLKQFQPAATEAQARLEQGTVTALASLIEPCSVFKTERYVVLRAECIRNVPD